MFNLVSLLVVAAVTGVSIYTFNFARYTGRQKNIRGAVGLYVLAALTFVIPLWLFFYRPF